MKCRRCASRGKDCTMRKVSEYERKEFGAEMKDFIITLWICDICRHRHKTSVVKG